MSWVKIDDQMSDHPKLIVAGPVAAWFWMCGMCYCARYLTDGFVPLGQVRKMADMDHDPLELAEKLVATGLWERTDGGFNVHDYLDYNPSREEVIAARGARMEAGRRGGRRSAANKQKATDIQANAQADAQASAQANAQAQPQANAQASAQADAQASAQAKVKQNSTPSPSPVPFPVPKPKTPAKQEDGGSEQPPPQRPPKRRSADPRTKHPAIQATKRVLGGRRYPPLEMYDRIIEVLGDSPDEAMLTACRREWRERGHNPESWKWLTEWYPAGGPPSQHRARASPREETDWVTAAEEEKSLRGSANPS